MSSTPTEPALIVTPCLRWGMLIFLKLHPALKRQQGREELSCFGLRMNRLSEVKISKWITLSAWYFPARPRMSPFFTSMTERGATIVSSSASTAVRSLLMHPMNTQPASSPCASDASVSRSRSSGGPHETMRRRTPMFGFASGPDKLNTVWRCAIYDVRGDGM